MTRSNIAGDGAPSAPPPAIGPAFGSALAGESGPASRARHPPYALPLPPILLAVKAGAISVDGTGALRYHRVSLPPW
jgi:hypothetical protein